MTLIEPGNVATLCPGRALGQAQLALVNVATNGRLACVFLFLTQIYAVEHEDTMECINLSGSGGLQISDSNPSLSLEWIGFDRDRTIGL